MSFLKKRNTIYVFIDASNVWSVVKSKKQFIEYKNIKKYFSKKFNTDDIKIFYYDSYPENGTREYSLEGKHKFYTYLKKGLGFVVRKKPLKRINTAIDGLGEIIKEKGNMDVEITIDAVHYLNKYNGAVFFTGDCDFLALVTYIRNASKKVYIYSTTDNISRELRTGGDGYVDIKKIDEIWGKELKHRVINKNSPQ